MPAEAFFFHQSVDYFLSTDFGIWGFRTDEDEWVEHNAGNLPGIGDTCIRIIQAIRDTLGELNDERVRKQKRDLDAELKIENHRRGLTDTKVAAVLATARHLETEALVIKAKSGKQSEHQAGGS